MLMHVLLCGVYYEFLVGIQVEVELLGHRGCIQLASVQSVKHLYNIVLYQFTPPACQLLYSLVNSW